MKAVLVMEMPENCEECPMHLEIGDTQGHVILNANICRGAGKRNMDSRRKPDWCPLVPMPEKQSYADLDEDADEGELTFAYRSGWNACVDAIERRKRK